MAEIEREHLSQLFLAFREHDQGVLRFEGCGVNHCRFFADLGEISLVTDAQGGRVYADDASADLTKKERRFTHKLQRFVGAHAVLEHEGADGLGLAGAKEGRNDQRGNGQLVHAAPSS
jgi:hypothetical protein